MQIAAILIDMAEPREGLRSIKKRMTRDLIADAALQLTLKKGLENVTSDEIAHIAFVSPRTVSNYFSCKEEAVVAAGSTLPELVEQYAHSPADDAPVQGLRRVVIDFFAARTHEQLEHARQRLQLTEQYPTLRAFEMASYGQAERDLRANIAQRIGANEDDDLYPSLAAAAAVSAVRSALWVWARSNAPDRSLSELVTAAFDHIENGLSISPVTQSAAPNVAPQRVGEPGVAQIRDHQVPAR
jgi:AcrR family transcriptional regulator